MIIPKFCKKIPNAPLTLFDLGIPNSFKEYEVEPGVFENFYYVIQELDIIEYLYLVDREV